MQTFRAKMSFSCKGLNTHFRMKGCALGLALKKRLKAARKRPIIVYLAKLQVLYLP